MRLKLGSMTHDVRTMSVWRVVQRRTPYNKRFTLPEDQIVSYFHSFLTEHFIEKNQLKKELDRARR